MPPLISCQNVSIAFGSRPLFTGLSITIQEGDRLGLIGPNGAGKSTLLKILAGLIPPDEGMRSARKLVRAGYVPQESEFPAGVSARDLVRAALTSEALDHAERETRAATALTQAGFRDLDAPAATLSGGWTKRLAIALELARAPEVLLLDEPTNHLDIAGIEWLEQLLKTAPFASVVVSHDRYFLENVTNRMAEVNRAFPGGLFRAEGNYSAFLEKREQFLEAQAKREEALATLVRREIEWLRRGAKARTSKSRARIDRAFELMDELDDVAGRNRTATAAIDFTATDRRSKRLIAMRGVSKSLGGRLLFQRLDLTLSPGLKVGLVGPNGSGKTTVLRLIEGDLEPDAGAIERADQLRIVHFDQHREQFDPALSLRRALAPEGDMIQFRGQAVHVAGWARRFLFREEQLEVPVSQLSGGERARVHIARLMTLEADILLLDEPTNDLDIPTLEVLEESLTGFPGALVLVTHDRYLLDRVTDRVLGLYGQAQAGLFADYRQWEAAAAEAEKATPVKPARPAREEPAPPQPRKKLSYLEQREWDTLEARIEEAEDRLAEHSAALQNPEVNRDPGKLRQAYAAMQAAQAAVDALYARWAELEEKLG
jgi:ABC transport system ATP-binding/permease protein